MAAQTINSMDSMVDWLRWYLVLSSMQLKYDARHLVTGTKGPSLDFAVDEGVLLASSHGFPRFIGEHW